MLTNFENFNLTFEQLQVFDIKVAFFNNLNSNLLLCTFVVRMFNNTVLTFTKNFTELVEVIKITVADRLFYGGYPLILLVLIFKIVNPTLVWEDKHKRMQCHSIFVNFLNLFFYIDAR